MKPILATLALFVLAFAGLRQLDPKGILFYQGVAVGSLIAAGLCAFLILSDSTSVLQACKDSLLTFCLIYMFVFTVPTTVDRAYSVEMLNRLASSGEGLSETEINAAYVKYFVERGGVEKRLKEQLETGTIRERNGKFVLTRTGRFLTRAFHVTAVIFKCGERSNH